MCIQKQHYYQYGLLNYIFTYHLMTKIIIGLRKAIRRLQAGQLYAMRLYEMPPIDRKTSGQQYINNIQAERLVVSVSGGSKN
jgi:hypothetical protein